MPRHPQGIVLLEGADSAGKTTLAKSLRQNYGARYIHGKLFKDPLRSHTAALRLALRWVAKDELVVIDRHWISHLIYGKVFLNQRYDKTGAETFDLILRNVGARTVLCIPSDKRRQEHDWEDGRGKGKTEHFNSVREVIELYQYLAFGNPDYCPVDTSYLSKLINTAALVDRHDVMIYDRLEFEDTPEKFVDFLIASLL